MITCYSCAKSFAMPTDDFGGTTLLCSPEDEDGCQYAEIPCLKYQRAVGAQVYGTDCEGVGKQCTIESN